MARPWVNRAAIVIYDGWGPTPPADHPSQYNLISGNVVDDKGIEVGQGVFAGEEGCVSPSETPWACPVPWPWTNNEGTIIVCNTVGDWVVAKNAHGHVVVACNTISGNPPVNFYNTDNAIWIKGVQYTGGTLVGSNQVELKAQVIYEGSSDGSGVEVIFTVNGVPTTVTTAAGGSASFTANLPANTVEVKVAVSSPCCEFIDLVNLGNQFGPLPPNQQHVGGEMFTANILVVSSPYLALIGVVAVAWVVLRRRRPT